MKARKGKGELLKVRETNSDNGFFCEGYEQDGGIEMCKYNFYFGWDFFFGRGWLLV